MKSSALDRTDHGGRLRVAVVGSGIAGLGAAWALSKRHAVTLFEQDKRLGGHAHTVEVDYDGTRIAVDTGFIVYNERNYPNLVRLFSHLGVPTEASDMSFGVSFGGGRLEWAGDGLSTLFAQKRNLFRLSHHRMWVDILRFNAAASRDLAAGTLDGLSLGDYLQQKRLGSAFRDRYLLPMGAAIWSMSKSAMLGFPARSFLEFLDNHSLIDAFNTLGWRTVSGGSKSYVDRIAADINGEICLGRGVVSIARDEAGAAIVDSAGVSTTFDQVVLACHSDQTLALLSDATSYERSLLGDLPYATNRAVLHRDTSLMPRRKAVWSSWNYVSEAPPRICDKPVSLTYWMNRLQNIDRGKPLFVTLNPEREPAADLTFGSFSYTHPQFDQAAGVAQRRLAMIQGVNRVWFCGAYCGHGFHEDGLTSGLEVAARLGAPAPWGEAGRPRIFTERLEAAE